MSQRNHVIITGTGRAGTTFLIELLTNLGIETGFSQDEIISKKHKQTHAGLELDITRDDCPFVVKDPWFCDFAEEIICRGDIVIEHIFVPIRDLEAAADSRRRVTDVYASGMPILRRLRHKIKPSQFPGGLWHTQSKRVGKQEEILLRQIYKLLFAVSNTTIPVTFIRYPKLVKDCSYLFDKLKPILGNIEFEFFCAAFNKTVRPELVHSFNRRDL